VPPPQGVAQNPTENGEVRTRWGLWVVPMAPVIMRESGSADQAREGTPVLAGRRSFLRGTVWGPGGLRMEASVQKCEAHRGAPRRGGMESAFLPKIQSGGRTCDAELRVTMHYQGDLSGPLKTNRLFERIVVSQICSLSTGTRLVGGRLKRTGQSRIVPQFSTYRQCQGLQISHSGWSPMRGMHGFRDIP
jgi:hypothetical protein